MVTQVTAMRAGSGVAAGNREVSGRYENSFYYRYYENEYSCIKR